MSSLLKCHTLPRWLNFNRCVFEIGMCSTLNNQHKWNCEEQYVAKEKPIGNDLLAINVDWLKFIRVLYWLLLIFIYVQGSALFL